MRAFDHAARTVVDVQDVAVGVQQDDAVVEFIERPGQQPSQRRCLHDAESGAVTLVGGARRVAQEQFQLLPPVSRPLCEAVLGIYAVKTIAGRESGGLALCEIHKAA